MSVSSEKRKGAGAGTPRPGAAEASPQWRAGGGVCEGGAGTGVGVASG